jgi:molybdate transport repressor ModE-like protein
MSIRFDLTDLRLFVHVAEAGSITHGAARANMTLASASERIRAMEEALNAPLLERKRRGVQLTSAGTVLLHHARIVSQQLEQMRGELDNFGKGLRGHVRLLSNIGAMEFLPVTLAAFLFCPSEYQRRPRASRERGDYSSNRRGPRRYRYCRRDR